MCFGGPSMIPVSQPTQSAPPPPPPPPAQTPRAPEIAPSETNKRQSATSQRQGTSVFRNDLTIPMGGGSVGTGGTGGAGINIPR